MNTFQAALMSVTCGVGLLSLTSLASLASITAHAQTSSSHLFKTDTKAEISLQTDQLDIELDEKTGTQQAILRGHVRAAQGPLTLESDKAVLQNPAGQVGTIKVSGNVVIMSKNGQQAKGDWAAYEIDKKIITMGDKVTLHQNGNKLQGQKLIIDTLTGIGTLTADAKQPGSRVRGVLTPGQK